VTHKNGGGGGGSTKIREKKVNPNISDLKRLLKRVRKKTFFDRVEEKIYKVFATSGHRIKKFKQRNRR